MALVRDHALRRREGLAPNPLVMMEAGHASGAGPVDMLREHYRYSGSVGVPELKGALQQIDAVHGRGAGRAAHQQMLQNGEVEKGMTGRRVAYRPRSEYGG